MGTTPNQRYWVELLGCTTLITNIPEKADNGVKNCWWIDCFWHFAGVSVCKIKDNSAMMKLVHFLWAACQCRGAPAADNSWHTNFIPTLFFVWFLGGCNQTGRLHELIWKLVCSTAIRPRAHPTPASWLQKVNQYLASHLDTYNRVTLFSWVPTNVLLVGCTCDDTSIHSMCLQGT